jgi:hypothetical protein
VRVANKAVKDLTRICRHSHGPLSQESLKLLLDWRETNFTEQSDDLIFAAFVRSLTPEQQSVMAGLMELVNAEEAFRWL